MSTRRGTGSAGLPFATRVVARTLLGCLSLFCTVRSAHADDETVLLMVPHTPEPALVELFHRVEAELRLHQFRPEVLVAPTADSTDSLLGAQASAQRAFAAIAIVEQAQSAMLQVWIVDSRTGLTRQYRVTQQGGEEPANVVAVRAIDLLRANRAPPSAAAVSAAPAGPAASAAAPGKAPPTAAGEPARQTGPAASSEQPAATTATTKKPSSAGAQTGATKPARSAGKPGTKAQAARRTAQPADAAADDSDELEIEDTSAPTTYRYSPTLLQISTEVVALSLSRRMGWSFGPSIGAWLTLGPRLRVGVVGVAPLLGAVLHAPLGDPSIWQELVWLEVGVVLARAGPLQLSAAGGAGLHWLQARGRAQAPYRSNNASTWSWTASLAARADVMLAEHWSLGLSLRARMFLPPVEVAVETESARLATPAIEGALGVSLWL